MKTDIEIAQSIELQPIVDVVKKIGIDYDDLELYGKYKAKLSFDKIQVDTLQKQLDSLIPGLMGLLLTFACMWLLKKKVSPITIIIGLFVVGIIASFFGIM